MSNASQQSLTPADQSKQVDTDSNTANTNTPMTNAESDTQNNTITILGGPPNLFRSCAADERDDLVADHNPDAYFLTGTQESNMGAKQLRYELPGQPPVLYPGNAHTGETEHITVNGVDIIVCPDFSDLHNIRSYEENGAIDTDTETVILSNLLSVSLRMDDLTASMDGLEEYVSSLQPELLSGSYTHISGAIDAGYCRDWDGLLVRGAGINNGRSGKKFLSFTISQDGMVLDETVDAGKLGLKAIDNVGPTTADRLKSNGYTTRDGIANASFEELLEIDGFGEKTADTVMKSAASVSRGEVIPTSDSAVPGSNPVFIDIETDGLNPTAVWLIGVRDGIDGNHMSFIETDPDNPGEAVQNFMMWFTANAAHRTVMAWNGWNFDFPVLREHIQKHCPEYLDEWERASKRDPLRWARDLNNAILPGRTNKLEHVAEALGWVGHETGLSGAEVARRYRAWMENPCDETELDWDKHKQYCKDDCAALELIYVALEESSRLESTDTEPTMNIEEETAQGSLFESY